MAVLTLADVGEFGLIARVTARLPPAPAALLGPGDDAAVVSAPDGRVVVTTDTLVEGRHFRRDWSSAFDVGVKAAAQSLADLAAMGAVPTALVVSLAAPADLPVAWAEGLADGLAAECSRAGTGVVGGDTVRSEVLTIGVTALGSLQGRPPVTRAGARPGDLVVVAGRLGWSAAGLALLERGEDALLTRHAALVAAHRRPSPPYAAGPRLALLGATAMADVSDGLLADLGHVATASGVGIVLDDAWPAPVLEAGCSALGLDPRVLYLTGGEDHALVATVPPATPTDGLAVLGRVVVGAGVRPPPGVTVQRAGFDHFGRPG